MLQASVGIARPLIRSRCFAGRQPLPESQGPQELRPKKPEKHQFYFVARAIPWPVGLGRNVCIHGRPDAEKDGEQTRPDDIKSAATAERGNPAPRNVMRRGGCPVSVHGSIRQSERYQVELLLFGRTSS